MPTPGDRVQIEITSTGDDELDAIAFCFAAIKPLVGRGGADAAVARYLYDRFDHQTNAGIGRGVNDA